MKNIFPALFYLLVFTACNQKPDFLNQGELLGFEPDKRLKVSGVIFNAEMKTAGGDSLLVLIHTSNEGEEPVSIRFTDVPLLTPESIRSVPVKLSENNLKLLPGEEAFDSVWYTPVNNKKLYDYTYRKGPFNQQYRLYLAATLNQQVENHIKLTAEAEQYNRYRKTLKARRYVFYRFKNPEQLKTQVDSLTGELENHSALSARTTVQVTDQEILAAGVITRIRAAREENVLSVNLRMVNHNGVPLEIIPENCLVKDSFGTSFKRLTVLRKNSPKGWEKSKLLNKSDRLELVIKYDLSTARPDTLYFRPHIKVQETGLPVIEEVILVADLREGS